MNEDSLSQLYLKDTAFQNLMQRRIFNVLLVASPYDAFMMEEDGRVEEQLYFEYVALNLSSPPRVTRVSNTTEALVELQRKDFDLIIMMPGVDVSETFSGAKLIKELLQRLRLLFSRHSRRKFPVDWQKKIFLQWIMCSVGLEMSICYWRLSSCWKIK